MFHYLFGALISSGILYISVSYLKCIKYKPKGYKKVSSKTVNHHTNVNNRDGFSMKKIPLDIDTIVIGSGKGGLTTAGLLSRVGQTVLVLEQHYIAGGSTHCFNDGSYEFDTGIHYVGNIRSRNKILDLITRKKIRWMPLGYDNDMMYENIVIDDKYYKFRQGKETMCA